MDWHDDMVLIETDTGDRGSGATVAAALQNLKATTAGTIFLDTADFLIVTGDGMAAMEQVKPYLKGTVRVCRGEVKMDLEEAARFLVVHKPKIRLKELIPESLREKICVVDGRMILSE